MFHDSVARALTRISVALQLSAATACIEAGERRMPDVATRDIDHDIDTRDVDLLIDTSDVALPDDTREADTNETDTRDADTPCMPGYSTAADSACAPCGAPTDDGLALYLTFDDADDLAHDLSGHHRDGVASHLTAVAGKLGSGARFDGVASMIALATDTKLENSRTLCTWVRPAASVGRGGPILVSPNGDKGPEPRVDRFGVTASDPAPGTCGAQTARSAPYADTKACVASPSLVPPGAWTFICFAWTEASKSLVVFVDGEVTSFADTSLVKTRLRDMTLGANPSGGTSTRAHFEGDLDEVALWTRALAASEMTTLYRDGEGCRIR